MKLRGIDHVEAMVTYRFEAGDDVIDRSAHHSFGALMAGVIEIEMLAHEAIGYAGKSIQRILDSVTEQLAADQLIIDGNAERELQRTAVADQAAVPEIQIVFPAGIKEFPLKIGHLDQLGAVSLLHARVFERHKKRGNECAFRVAQIIEQLQRLFGVGFCFTRETEDKRAEREPVVLVENL